MTQPVDSEEEGQSSIMARQWVKEKNENEWSPTNILCDIFTINVAHSWLYQRSFVFRDLKPSNIFMREDLSISLGDFGVATIMGDARTRTRTTVGESLCLTENASLNNSN